MVIARMSFSALSYYLLLANRLLLTLSIVDVKKKGRHICTSSM